MKRIMPVLVTALVAARASPAPETSIHDPGQRLFNDYGEKNVGCYTCHAGDASGAWKGSNLIGIGQRETREEIMQAIRTGPGILPSYEADLTQDEIGAIADWLATLE